jgi:hypothetical protein
MLDIHFQPQAAARRQRQGLGLSRVAEIGNVTPVVRGRPPCSLLFQQTPDQGMTARAGGPEYVDIVSVDANSGRELNRLHGTGLAGNIFQFGQFSGGFEVKTCGIAMPEQHLRQ